MILQGIKNILFLLNVSGIIFSETITYGVFRNYSSFIDRLTSKLAKINILYVKIFQAFALNNSLIDDNVNNKLMKFTDNAPWTLETDVDMDILLDLEQEYKLKILDNYTPINSGMISLVFKAHSYDKDEIMIVKIKRKNIDIRLEEAINNLLFFIYCLSFIPIVNRYQISEVINKNIGLIRSQTNLVDEVDNMVKVKHNCKNLKYVKVPAVYSDITYDYPSVIVMEYIQGLTINKIDEPDYEEFAKQVMKFGFVTAYVHGFAHGDLHSGNILFIKDDTCEDKYKYKIGVLDFGIMYSIDESFKNKLFEMISELFRSTPRETAERFLTCGFVEPQDIIENLPKEHYNNLIEIGAKIIDITLNNEKGANQMRLFQFITSFNKYVNDNELYKLGLRPSDNFVKSQLALSMAMGVTLTLCKEDYSSFANKVINELFHTDLLDFEL